jgi:hypothetical protein
VGEKVDDTVPTQLVTQVSPSSLQVVPASLSAESLLADSIVTSIASFLAAGGRSPGLLGRVLLAVAAVSTCSRGRPNASCMSLAKYWPLSRSSDIFQALKQDIIAASETNIV